MNYTSIRITYTPYSSPALYSSLIISSFVSKTSYDSYAYRIYISSITKYPMRYCVVNTYI